MEQHFLEFTEKKITSQDIAKFSDTSLADLAKFPEFSVEWFVLGGLLFRDFLETFPISLFDRHARMHVHVKNVCQASFYHLRNISKLEDI